MQQSFFNEMAEAFGALPDGPPEEGSIRLRLPFERMERMKAILDEVKNPGETYAMTIERVVKYVAKVRPEDSASIETGGGSPMSQIPLQR